MTHPRDVAPSQQPRLVVAYGHLPAHHLLRLEVASFHGVSADRVLLGHACPHCGSDEHGRPLVLPVPGLRRPAHVSLSRAGSLSVVAVTDVGPVGVDAEDVDAAARHGIDEVALHPWEVGAGIDAGRAWVRTEAVLKAAGLGLRVDPRDVALDGSGIVAWESGHPHPGDVRVRDLEIPRVLAAAAVLVPGAMALDDVAVTCRAARHE